MAKSPAFSFRRLFLLFVAGIILPSTFLIYLGLASIRAETRLLQKESTERLGTTLEALVNQLDQNLHVTASGLESWVAGANLSRKARLSPADTASLTQLQRGSGQAWTDVIVLDAQNAVQFPFTSVPSRPSPLPPLPESLDKRLEAAERREFSQKDWAGAAAEYDALAQQVSAPVWRASLGMRAAGCWTKLQAWLKAEDAYRDIQTRYSLERNEQGYPFGLLSAIQMGELLASAGRLSAAIDHDFTVLQDLLGGRWGLGVTDERFFTQRVMQRVSNLENRMSVTQKTAWARWREEETARRLRLERTQTWVQKDWPLVQASLRKAQRSDVSTLLWGENPAIVEVVIPVFDPTGSQRLWTIFGRLKKETILQQWVSVLDPAALAGPLAYQLESVKDQPILQSSAWTQRSAVVLSRPLSSIVPPVTLTIAATGVLPADQLASRRRHIYVAMVALAGLVIAVALYVTWMAVRREMEVAQLKARFVASMSHELKTPLSIIDLVGQKLKRGRYSSPQEAEDYYAMLTDETTRLKGLIEDVLDFSRLMENRAPFTLVALDWVPLIRTTIERFQTTEIAQGASIRFETSLTTCPIRGNADALGRVLINLLENAIKYSPPDRIQLRVTLDVQSAHAVLSVHDQGYGIPIEEQKLIFDRFYRGRSSHQERPISGTGLGLSIVQHIVQAHGGTIELESVVNQGSVFRVRLPHV